MNMYASAKASRLLAIPLVLLLLTFIVTSFSVRAEDADEATATEIFVEDATDPANAGDDDTVDDAAEPSDTATAIDASFAPHDANGVSIPGYEVILRADPNVNRVYIPPPAQNPENVAGRAVPFTVQYNPAGCNTADFGPTAPWPDAARTAFEFGMNVWGNQLNGTQTINIRACWHTGMDPNTLGSAGARWIFRDFENAPVAGTFYPVALANQLAGRDLDADVDITAQFNANFNWFFGTGPMPDPPRQDFVSVVLHEIGHGLGFIGGMTVNNEGMGRWWNSHPNIWDRFTVRRNTNGSTTPLLSFTNPSVALGNALTSNSVYFVGTNARGVNCDDPAVYAPNPWDEGSSYSHLMGSVLMKFSLAAGEQIHSPLPYDLAVLEDLGWDIDRRDFYVNRNNSGEGVGTPGNPFRTVGQGVNSVQNSRTVFIAPGNYNELLTIDRPLTLQAICNGTVALGAP